MSNEHDETKDPNATATEGGAPSGTDPGPGLGGSGPEETVSTVAPSGTDPSTELESGAGSELVAQKAEDAIPAINETTDLATLEAALAQEQAGKKRKTVLEAIEARKLDLQTSPSAPATTPTPTESGVKPDDDTIDGSTVVSPPSQSDETKNVLADIKHEIQTGQKRPSLQGNVQLPDTVTFDGKEYEVFKGPCPDCERQDQAWDWVQVRDPNNADKTIDVRVYVCEHKKVS